MTDTPTLQPILSGEEATAFSRAAARFNADQAARSRRETLKTVALGGMAAFGVSGWIAWALKPRIEERFSVVPIREDGTVALTYRLEDLPLEAQRDATMAVVIQYVMARESYSSGKMEANYKFVQAMSDDRVRKEYVDANNPLNPQSPYKIYGNVGVVDIEYVDHEDVVPMEGYRGLPPGYSVRYWRTERRDVMTPPMRAMWKATMRFHRDVANIDPRFRRAFNPPGIQVWEYPNPVQLSVPQVWRGR